MSDVKRVEILRNLYKAQQGDSFNGLERSIKNAVIELKVANDMQASKQVASANNSPYLTDQPYYNPEVVFNSSQETEWREVKTFEETRKDALVFRNLKRLNII